MGDKYGECQKSQSHIGGKTDGCQQFTMSWRSPSDCAICGCHQNYHRKVVEYKTEIVYTTKCHKIHEFKFQNTVDGCQEFTPAGPDGTMRAKTCDVCGCHKGFHRNEVTKQVT